MSQTNRTNFALTDREKRSRKAAAAAVEQGRDQSLVVVAVQISPSDIVGYSHIAGGFTPACLRLRVSPQLSAAALGGARHGIGTRRVRRRRGRTPRDALGVRRTADAGRSRPRWVSVAGCSGPHINVGCCEVGCATRTRQETGAPLRHPGRLTWWAPPPVTPSATPRRASASAARHAGYRGEEEVKAEFV